MDPNIADWLSQYSRANSADPPDLELMKELKTKIDARKSKLLDEEGHCGIDESHLANGNQ